MTADIDITEIFYRRLLPVFELLWKKYLLEDAKTRRNRNSRISFSEIMTILILFHQSQMKIFKDICIRIVNG